MSYNFSQITKSRHIVKDNRSDGSKSVLKDAVLQLVTYHQDVKVILSEASSISITKAEKIQGGEDKIITARILKECVQNSTSGSTVLHTAEECATELLKMVNSLNRKQREDNASIMESIEMYISVVKELMKGQYFNRPRFLNILCNETCLPVPIMYILHEENIMSVASYLRFKQTDSKFISEFAEEILNSGETNKDRTYFNGVVSLLVNYSFPEKSETDHSVKKVCTTVLTQTICQHLNNMKNDKKSLLISLVPCDHMICSDVSLKKYGCFLLQQIFTYNPTISVAESFCLQKNWKFAKLPIQFTELCKEIILVLDTADVLEMLKQTLDTADVNWHHYCAFWSVFIICTQKSRTLAEDVLLELLKMAFEESRTDHILKVFLICRQCCNEGSHVFHSYQDWFLNLFGDSQRSLANSKKTFTYLMKVLTDLVPYDQPSCLKVHILRPPFVPSKCKDLLSDYIVLGKTRLADLKEPLEQVGMFDTSSGSSSFKNQIEEDVQKALAAFETNNKMPSAVMEASIFRKSYFIGKFIPALLKPRPLPDIPDARMIFIEALRKVEKIPPNMYKTYEIDCKKEAANLLQGVFMEIDDDEDDDVEMTMTTMEQFDHRLNQMMDKIINKQWQKHLPEMISVLKEKINVLLTNHEESICTKNLLQINMNTKINQLQFKIVNGLLNLFCKVSEACLVLDQPDLSWAVQLVDMLGEFTTLHHTLFVVITRLVTYQINEMESHHIAGLSTLLTFMAMKSQIFGLVEFSPCTSIYCKEKQYFTQKLWTCLPLQTAQQMIFCLRLVSSYLFCVFNVVDNSCLLEEDYNRIFPHILIQKFMFLCERLIPELKQRPLQQTTSGELLTALYIYKSKQFKEIKHNMQLTFEVWLKMELAVCPNQDMLSDFERQEYLNDCIHKHYMVTTKEDGGCNYDYRYTCSIMLESVIHSDMRSHNNNDMYCPLCLKRCKMTNSKVIIIQYLQELSWFLPSSIYSADDSRPWLMSHLQSLSKNYSTSWSLEAVIKTFFRTVCCLPRHLFYSDSITDLMINEDLILSTINGEMGMIQVKQAIDIDKIFTACPIMLTSLLVYLPTTKYLIAQVTFKNSNLVSVIGWLKRALEGHFPNFDDCPPWMYAAALLSLCINRDQVEDKISQFLSQKTNKNSLILKELVVILIAHTAYQHLDVPRFHKVLDVIQKSSPDIILTLPNESIIKQMCSSSTQSIIPYRLLMYISKGHLYNHYKSIPDFLRKVLSLYSMVVNLCDEENSGSCPHLQSELEVSRFVQKCIARSPDFVLKDIDKDLLKKCGMEITLAVQERYK
ncbi:Fanconi anemia group A protein homolog isoform X2 [Mytilus trossulus]|uniref:Fanconi anemia group A protein homolog isoform X2 n=1 Tax=Mytilus trossulus TaxID=6551 RepID=UPI003007E79A